MCIYVFAYKNISRYNNLTFAELMFEKCPEPQ